MMGNSGDTGGTATRRRRLLDDYLLAERCRAWGPAHPGWSLDRRADFGYWEAFRVRCGGAERTVVCRHSLDDLDVRVDEIMAAEAKAEAAAKAAVREAWGLGPGP